MQESDIFLLSVLFGELDYFKLCLKIIFVYITYRKPTKLVTIFVPDVEYKRFTNASIKQGHLDAYVITHY